MARIYTRLGDTGMTGISGGIRVAKTDVRIEANGTLDELNSIIGIVRSYTSANDSLRDGILRQIQENLMKIMSVLATPAEFREMKGKKFSADSVKELESRLDDISAKGNMEHEFILPGGCREAAFLHLARTVCRRGERDLWRLHAGDPVEESILCYVNRLSDLFFAMARDINCERGVDNESWKRFGKQ